MLRDCLCMAHTLLTLEGCSHHAKVQMAGSDSPPNGLLLFWVGLWSCWTFGRKAIAAQRARLRMLDQLTY